MVADSQCTIYSFLRRVPYLPVYQEHFLMHLDFWVSVLLVEGVVGDQPMSCRILTEFAAQKPRWATSRWNFH